MSPESFSVSNYHSHCVAPPHSAIVRLHRWEFVADGAAVPLNAVAKPSSDASTSRKRQAETKLFEFAV